MAADPEDFLVEKLPAELPRTRHAVADKAEADKLRADMLIPHNRVARAAIPAGVEAK